MDGRRRVGTGALAATVLALAAAASTACGGDRGVAGGQVADGRRVFEGRCASCHGASLEGTDAAPALRVEVPGGRDAVGIAVRTAVRRGVDSGGGYTAMPAVPGISDDELDDLVVYLDAACEGRG